MIISILKDSDTQDISLTTEAIAVLVKNQHTVLIDGESENVAASAYMSVGAYIINTKEELLDRSDLIIKRTAPLASDINYLNGEEKIFLTKLKVSQQLIQSLLRHRISVIDYSSLPIFKIVDDRAHSKLKFSNDILPFVLKLADKGLKALVDDETLRTGLIVMRGKVYSPKIAKALNLTCHEF